MSHWYFKACRFFTVGVCISVPAYESRQFPPVEKDMLSCLPKRGFLRISDELCYRETLMTEPSLHGAILGESLESLCCGNRDGHVDSEESRSQNLQVSTNVTVNAKVQIYKHESGNIF